MTMPKPKLDEQGNQVLDEQGNPVYEPEVPPTPPGDGAPATLKDFAEVQAQLKELRELLVKPGTPQEDVKRRIQEIEQATGFKEPQIKFMIEAIHKTLSSELVTMKEGQGKDKAQLVLGEKKELFKEVEDFMAKQPVEIRANPEAWESAAFMTLGRNATKGTTIRTVIGGAPLTQPVGAPAAGGSRKTYTPDEQRDRQLMANLYFKGNLDEMDKYAAKGKTIGQGTYVPPAQLNAADRELAKLIGSRV